ncbi:hypothetical protein GW17_00036062, partial [Ensete ventricosum]
ADHSRLGRLRRRPLASKPSAAARASPQGVANASGLQAATRRGGTSGQKRRSQGLSLVASKGSARSGLVRRGVAPVEVSLAGAEPTARVTASWQGNRRPRRGGVGGDGGAEGARGVRAFLLRKRLFSPFKFEKF